MNNPNSPFARLKKFLSARWSCEDYPGAEPRFQLSLLARDIGVFVLLPAVAVFMFKSCENAMTGPRRNQISREYPKDLSNLSESPSQIINFYPSGGGAGGLNSGIAKKSPGTLVRLKLLNVVETFFNVPVHAQITNAGLGRNLMGGTLIGDAVSDTNYDRINITFKYVKDPYREGVAIPISARALALDGTLGLIAKKKEGFFARSAIGSTSATNQELQGRSGTDTKDLKQFLARALTAGLLQEFGSETQVEKNRAQVLTLVPGSDFFAELTDFFPGSGR